MGLLVKETVILEMNGYLVIQLVIPANGYRRYMIARGTSDRYSFVFQNGKQASFIDLIDCEAYFSGLLTNEYIEREVCEREALSVRDGVVPLMERIKERFSKIELQ